MNPVLALLPLVETGPVEDTDCRAVLEPVKGAVRQSGGSEDDAPAKRGRPGGAEASAASRSSETVGLERGKSAPIVDVPTKK